MSDLPALRSTEVVAALERLGFREARHKGSRVILRHVDGRWAPCQFTGGEISTPVC